MPKNAQNKNASIEFEIISIADLKLDDNNARTHTPRNIGTIVDALHEVGAARSGVIDEENTVLVGNGTLEGLAQAGIERVKVVDAEADEWVVVRRTGLTEEQKKRLAIFDNRTADLARWDPEKLLELGDSMLSGLWNDIERRELEIKIANEPAEATQSPGDGDQAESEYRCPLCSYEW